MPIAFSPDLRKIAWAHFGEQGSDDIVQLGSAVYLMTNRGVRTMQVARLPDLWVTSVAFSPDGQNLAVGIRHQPTRVIQISTGKELQRLGDNGAGRAVFTPDGTKLLLGSAGSHARFYDLRSGSVTRELTELPGANLVCIASSGRIVAGASEGGRAMVWASDGTCRELSLPEGKLRAVQLSPDGRLIGCAIRGHILVFNAVTGKLLHDLIHLDEDGEEAVVWCVAFSADGQRVAAPTNTFLRIWEVDSGKVVLCPALAGLMALAFSEDGNTILGVRDTDGSVQRFHFVNPTWHWLRKLLANWRG